MNSAAQQNQPFGTGCVPEISHAARRVVAELLTRAVVRRLDAQKPVAIVRLGETPQGGRFGGPG